MTILNEMAFPNEGNKTKLEIHVQHKFKTVHSKRNRKIYPDSTFILFITLEFKVSPNSNSITPLNQMFLSQFVPPGLAAYS